ncbi:unnamed protein product [Heterobilharzia americana]|nr:unnamed protein product [Heterobilharzia americana]
MESYQILPFTMYTEETYSFQQFHDGYNGDNNNNNHDNNQQLLIHQPINVEDYLKENQMLKLKISEISKLFEVNEINFSHRLGATEYELEQCKKVNEVVLSQHLARIQTLQSEGQAYQNQLSGLKIELEQCKQTIKLKEEKIDQMEIYLSKLPTLDDYKETVNKLQLIKNQNHLLEKRIEEYKKKLNDCDSQLTEAKTQIKYNKECEQMLQTQLDAAMERLYQRKSGKSNLNGIKVTPIFVEDLKFELERYRLAFEQTKKLLEAETCRAEAAETRQKLDYREFSEYRAREEAEITGLKASLSTRRIEIKQLKERISEITQEKQDLLSNLFEAHNALINILSIWKSSNGQLCQRLNEYIQENVNEIVRLAKQLNHLANGRKLDLSELLIQPKPLTNSISDILVDSGRVDEEITADHKSTEDLSLSLLQPRNADGIDANESWQDSFYNAIQTASQLSDNINEEQLHNSLGQLKETRTMLLELRQQLASKYADHLGGKIDCTIQ